MKSVTCLKSYIGLAHRKHLLATLLLVLTSALLSIPLTRLAAQSGTQIPTQYTISGDKVFPESIVFQEKTGDFYVSSYGDGSVFKGNIAQPDLAVFLPPGGDGRTAIGGVKLDKEGHLFVCGAGSGQILIYDTATKALVAKLDTGNEPNTVINDSAIADDGTGYFTDSLTPTLFKVSRDSSGKYAVEKWLSLDGTPITYTKGLNLNGIVITADQKYLIAVTTNTGRLFRIEIASKKVTEIDLGGQPILNTDGLFLQGNVLYAARNADNLLAVLDLSPDYTKATLRFTLGNPAFRFPVSIVAARGRLLVLNGQLDKIGGSPSLPFDITAIQLPVIQ